ncbi:tetratricopeptide repeat protein [Roseivirga sp.]|uniref:tetratricopeptide repeat protein n=1 Tax=Roseivirga sp. TaxID=1964215 RepID=UPI002B26A840|nr:tetratricopeptide repeat protein [Roseivirga sp.]
MKPLSRELKIYSSLLILLSSVCLLFWIIYKPKSPDEIFASNFQPYEAPSNFRGNDLTTMDNDYILGLIEYDQGNYPLAISLFEQTVEKDALNYSARFLLGISFMAQKDFDNAEPILKQMAEDPSHLFQDQARWYLGLIYLSDENEDNDDLSKALFDKIENESLRKKVKSL